MSLSSRPALLQMMTAVLRRTVQHRPGLLFDPHSNPLLRWVLRHTFYAQFCAGEDEASVAACARELRRLGYQGEFACLEYLRSESLPTTFAGVMLEYARELVEEDVLADTLDEQQLIDSWRDGLLESIKVCSSNDFLAFKWSGMGKAALRRLVAGHPPSGEMLQAMESICEAAASKGIKLLPAAEPQNAQKSVDEWTLLLSKRYNRRQAGHAVLYNTYQCYLRSTPQTLSGHLSLASKEGFTLGIKLVRGAYLHSEPRHLIWDSIHDTHACYDDICSDLLWRTYGGRLCGAHLQPFPSINMVIASHNWASVEKVRHIRDQQLSQALEPVPLAYAQLYGMADEVSCRLIQPRAPAQPSEQGRRVAERPQTYKYVSWGSLKDCLNYLLRRAAENKEAFARTVETRDVARAELWRRAKASVGR